MKRIITIICFFFLVVTLSAQDISSALRQAQARFDSGNETGGIELVNKVLAKYPDNKEAKELLARRGFNPIYGARPLKRVIRQMVENPLSKLLLAQKFIDGDTVKIGVKDDEIEFSK